MKGLHCENLSERQIFFHSKQRDHKTSFLWRYWPLLKADVIYPREINEMQKINELEIQHENNDNPSLLDYNLAIFEECKKRDFPVKNKIFNILLDVLEDPILAEVIWSYYGDDSIEAIDDAASYFNKTRSWWKFWKKKNTIRLLVKSPNGKRWVWQMFHDLRALTE